MVVKEDDDLGFDEGKLEAEVAKQVGDVESQESESTPDKKQEKQKEEPSDDESTRPDPSLKTEEVADEGKNEQDKTEDEETPFHKHPRWQKLQQERDEAIQKSQQFEELKSKLEDFDVDELTKLKQAGTLLRKYPELANKVQKIIDEHPYDNEAVKSEVNTVKNEVSRIREELALERYDNTVSKLLIDKKLDKDTEEIVKEMLDNRVINKRLGLDSIPTELDSIIKKVNIINRRNLASHVETKKSESNVPTSPDHRGKVIMAKKESSETEDIISELAEGLKATRSEMKE